MKTDAINSAKYIARFCRFTTQASYCGHCSSEEVNRYEEEARDLILNASNQDFKDAFDECVECGMNEEEVTSGNILRAIGDKAKTDCESLILDGVNVIDEKSVSDLSFDLKLKALKKEKKMVIKEYSTAWLKEEIRIVQEAVEANPHMAATLLLGDLKRYVEHISANAKSKGKVTSARKAASSAANGAKGGRPKGSKNKKKIIEE